MDDGAVNESKPHRTRAADTSADAAPWPYTQQKPSSSSIISPFLLHLAQLLRKALSSSIIEAHNSSTLLPPFKNLRVPPHRHTPPIVLPSIITLPSHSTKTYLRRRTRGRPIRRPAARLHWRGRASSSESRDGWVCCLCGLW